MSHYGPQPKAVITTTKTPGQTVVQVQTNGPVSASTAAVISQTLAAAQNNLPVMPSLPTPVVLLPQPAPVIHGMHRVIHGHPAAHRPIHAPVGLQGPVGIHKPKHKVKHTRTLIGNPHPHAAPMLPAAAIHHANQPPLRQVAAPTHVVPQPSSSAVRTVIRKK